MRGAWEILSSVAGVRSERKRLLEEVDAGRGFGVVAVVGAAIHGKEIDAELGHVASGGACIDELPDVEAEPSEIDEWLLTTGRWKQTDDLASASERLCHCVVRGLDV
jgi:hypothetical protein